MLETISWFIDGISVDVDDGWQCSTTAPGGHDRATVTIPARDGRRILQESVLTAQRQSGRPLWEGKISASPFVNDGRMRVEATGFKVWGEKSARRLPYQIRDYQQWSPEDSEPYNYVTDPDVHLDNSNGHLQYMCPDVTVTPDKAAFVFEIPGEAGRLYSPTSIGFKAITTASASNQMSYGLQRATPPDPANGTAAGTRQNITGGSPSPASWDAWTGSSGTRVVTFGIPTDATNTLTVLSLWGDFHLSATGVISIVELCVNYLGARVYTASQVIAHSASMLAFDVSGVAASGTDTMPQDHIGPWTSLWDEMSLLADWPWMVLEDRGLGPHMQFRPWDSRVWRVATTHNAIADLTFPEIHNVVVVTFTDTGGRIREIVKRADPDPLSRAARDNEFYVNLPGVWEDTKVPYLVAQRLIDYYSQQRIRGTVQAVGVYENGVEVSPYDVVAGEMCVIDDVGVPVAQRIVSVSYDQSGVQLTLDRDTSIDRIMTLYADQILRAPSNLTRTDLIHAMFAGRDTHIRPTS